VAPDGAPTGGLTHVCARPRMGGLSGDGARYVRSSDSGAVTVRLKADTTYGCTLG